MSYISRKSFLRQWVDSSVSSIDGQVVMVIQADLNCMYYYLLALISDPTKHKPFGFLVVYNSLSENNLPAPDKP